jgi:F-type H+-transporting ATPase subunit a
MLLKANRLAVFFVWITALIHPQRLKAGAAGQGPFDPGKIILSHINDAYEWHLWGNTSIPLPVILYSKERRLEVFMSSKFQHGTMTYRGYMIKDNNIVAVNELGNIPVHMATINETLTAQLWEISITKNVAAMLISMALICWIFISVARTYTRHPDRPPRGLQSLLEPIIVFVRDDVIKASIGPRYERYLPYLMTAFFFIWINNILGLVPVFPGGANLTGNIAVTMTLAVLTFLITNLSGNKHYWHHIFAMPGVPRWVLILLTPIEIMGVFLRPFVLMIRLFANITAGHIILLSFVSLIFIFSDEGRNIVAGYGVGIVSLLFTVFMSCLELLVAFLQAYVFTLLSAMYIGTAVEEPAEHETVHNH